MRKQLENKNVRTAPCKRALSHFLGVVMVAALLACCGMTAHDAWADSEKYTFEKLKLTQHKSRTLEIATPFSLAVVGAPDIADTLPMSDRVLYIQGKKAGTTNISVFGPNKELIGIIDVEVNVDIPLVARAGRSLSPRQQSEITPLFLAQNPPDAGRSSLPPESWETDRGASGVRHSEPRSDTGHT